jgi:hypothetical protein
MSARAEDVTAITILRPVGDTGRSKQARRYILANKTGPRITGPPDSQRALRRLSSGIPFQMPVAQGPTRNGASIVQV